MSQPDINLRPPYRRTRLFREFFESEKSGGITLLFCTIASLLLANFAFGENYVAFWQRYVGGLTIEHWVNDGLMAIFFLLIGLELEREIYHGELSNVRDALLPITGAVGGIVIPAGIYLLFNAGTDTSSGAGIPMATDIAFALGILSLLGNRVPTSLKVFLTALAVIDDLIAILVIAIFYSKGIAWPYLLGAAGVMAVLFALNRFKISQLWPYLFGGVVMWYLMLNSGIHATITGVLLAFVIPFGTGGKRSTSYVLQHALHKPVAFLILPIFALVNTALVIEGDPRQLLGEAYSLGISLGLMVGKPLGIFAAVAIALRLGWVGLPIDLRRTHIFGVGLLAGIGFTMSIFITLLAFDDPIVVKNAKLVIIVSSLAVGLFGYLFLRSVLPAAVSDLRPEEED